MSTMVLLAECLSTGKGGPEPGSTGDLSELTAKFSAHWHLPSDHLPIGVKIGTISVVSWNVLNHVFVKDLRQLIPVLEGTALKSDAVLAPDSDTITIREQRAAATVRDLASKFDVVLLQECGGYFLEELQRMLPRGSVLHRGVRQHVRNDICAIINTRRISVDFQSSDFLESGYSVRENRAIMNLALRTRGGERLRVIHSHVPGEPGYVAQREFARYSRPYCANAESPVLLAGDLNVTEPHARAQFKEEGLPDFLALNKLNTTPDSAGSPKRIDQFFLFGAAPKWSAIPPEKFSDDAAEAAAFLNPR